MYQPQTPLSDYQSGHFPPKQYQELHSPNQIQFDEQYYRIKPRVSQKLRSNKLRKLEIDFQKNQTKQHVISQKLKKMEQINLNNQKKMQYCNFLKELRMKDHNQQRQEVHRQFQKKMNQVEIRHAKHMAKIEKGRLRAAENQKQNVFRIHQKITSNFNKVRKNKHFIDSEEMNSSMKFHMKEWNQYQQVLKKKYSGQTRNSPDYLYQKYKEKNQEIANKTQKQNPSKEEEQKQPQTAKIIQTNKVQTKKLNLQYYGIHDKDPFIVISNQIQSMRQFIKQNRQKTDIQNDQELYLLFEQFIDQNLSI